MKKLDDILDWLAYKIVIILFILLMIWLFINYVYPYWAGNYEFFVKYHNSIKP